MRAWSDEELELLLGWMEENQELLRGSAVLWMGKAKEAVFADNVDKDVKKIKSKYHNMRTAWKAAKKLQEQSGFGVREDDCTNSVNGKIFQFFANCEAAAAYHVRLEVLNKKCRFFWRFDEIFGTRLNSNPVITADTLSQQQLPSEQAPPSELQPQTQFDPLLLGPDDWPESDAEQQESGDHAESLRNGVARTRAPSTSATSVLASSARTQSRPRPSASSRRNKGDGEFRRLVELNRRELAEREEKRQKIQADAQIEVARIQAASQERIMEKKMQMKREEGEKQMQVQREERELQREREERQLQMFQAMMASMIQVATTRSNHTNDNDSS